MNVSNLGRQLAQIERSINILIVDTCRTVTQDLELEESEKPLRDFGQYKGQAVLLFSGDIGDKVVEWAPNPINHLHYCEGSYEFLQHLDRLVTQTKHYSLGEVLKSYKYRGYSE